jgi:FKBP-type peptidyl-prolyl cis-trans isomerase 2
MARTASSTPLVVLIVIVVIAAGVGAGVLYLTTHPGAPAHAALVQQGDNVSVNYIGIFGSGPQSGRVFDTSVYSVAANNATYPKSLEYHSRGNRPANYTPLDVHVGPNTPSSGYSLGNLTFIGVVPGFWQGLVGIPVNITRAVVVPVQLGYGLPNPACLVLRPLTYSLPLYATLPIAQFNAQYPGITAAPGVEFPDPHYSWPVLVFSSNASFVTIENLPHAGSVGYPYGWPVLVTSISPNPINVGQISLVNELDPAQAGLVLGRDFGSSPPCNTVSHGQFIVSGIQSGTGTFTANYNTEVTGQTLIFDVTVTGIYK